MSTCTITGDFAGIPIPACGRDATMASSGRCERGHERTRMICADHAHVFALMPATVMCAQCAEAGDDNVPMAVELRPAGVDQ